MPSPVVVEGLAWATRNLHGLPGRWRIVRWLEQHEAALAALPPKTLRFAGDLHVRVHPRDENGRRIYVHGFDPRERLTRHFIRLLRTGDCVLDIGANVGYYTLVAARLVGSAGCVHAFEPSPQTLPHLRTNARLNPLANIDVHGAAVTDRCGQTQFFMATPERTGYSSIRDLGREAGGVTTVPTVSIDSLLDDLPAVRLVKIDVEGAELLALRGMRRLLERDRPFLILEVDDGFLRELGGAARQVCELLTERGYELHSIVERGDLVPLTGSPVERCNVLACPRTAEGLAAGR
jgi:FkbM family methyltransferase